MRKTNFKVGQEVYIVEGDDTSIYDISPFIPKYENMDRSRSCVGDDSGSLRDF